MTPSGYFVGSGFVGFVRGEKMLFADESDYREYLSGEEPEDNGDESAS